ncbi:hypothetical protein QQP08_003345 [Theobroma cacao]|nr:hypothetical protein QQP08_003345 [Theobroma cacao]
MSRKKVHSQGNIPFSWEDKPGVSKVTHYDDQCPIVIGLCALNQTPSPSDAGGSKILVHDKKVPPPPCTMQLVPKRSTSVKGLRWWQEDPFLAAYKECTKGGGNGKWSSEGSWHRAFEASEIKRKVSTVQETLLLPKDYIYTLPPNIYGNSVEHQNHCITGIPFNLLLNYFSIIAA